jgi:hypothetical protein
VTVTRRGQALYDDPRQYSDDEDERDRGRAVTPLRKKADVRADAGAKAGSGAAKKGKAQKNDRAQLHHHNGFSDYDGSKTTKTVRLRQDIVDSWEEALDGNFTMCCTRCLWSVTSAHMSTTVPSEMHLVCNGPFNEKKPNVETRGAWMMMVEDELWVRWTTAVVALWEADETEGADVDTEYFLRRLQEALELLYSAYPT